MIRESGVICRILDVHESNQQERYARRSERGPSVTYEEGTSRDRSHLYLRLQVNMRPRGYFVIFEQALDYGAGGRMMD